MAIKNTSANRARLTSQLKSAQATLKGLSPTDAKSKGLIRQTSDMLRQTKAEGGKQFAGSSFDTQDYIPTQNIASTDMTTPTPTGDVWTQPDVGGAGALAGLGATVEQQMETKQKTETTGLQDLWDKIGAPQNKENILTGLEQAAGLEQKKEEVNKYQGQLNQIVAGTQANQLAVVGQGRGIPEAIIGGQQAQIAREGAIQALPVAAQLEAARGNLEMAQAHIDKLFAIKSADADAKYNYKKDRLTSYYNLATAQEKEKLDLVSKMQDRRYAETQANLATSDTWAKMAIETGQSSLAGKISALNHEDPNYRKNLAALQAQIKLPVKSDTPASYQEWVLAGQPGTYAEWLGKGTGGVSDYAGERAIRTIQSVDELYEQVNDKTIGWGSMLAGIPGTDAKYFRTQADTLIANITFGELTAMREASKTGGALGQVSDREGRLLGAALGALQDRRITPEQYKTQLRKVKESILRWNNAASNYGFQQAPITAPTGEEVIIID